MDETHDLELLQIALVLFNVFVLILLVSRVDELRNRK